MSFTAVIDISTFIWCEEDYNANKNRYYTLIGIAPAIFEKIKELKLSILLKKELYESMMAEFPYKMISEISYEFQNITLSFLTNTDWFPYSDKTDPAITSVPILSKPHFSDDINGETQSQICHLFYNGKKPDHKFIAYSYFFAQDNDLILNMRDDSTKIDTLRYDTENDIVEFFEKYRLKFQHNPKHTRELRYSGGEKISPFTCYHQPNGQLKAKKLFEEATFHEGYYYNFDLDNNVYVRFLKTHIDQPIYHGHDLSDQNDDVPDRIRKKINKHGRIF